MHTCTGCHLVALVTSNITETSYTWRVSLAINAMRWGREKERKARTFLLSPHLTGEFIVARSVTMFSSDPSSSAATISDQAICFSALLHCSLCKPQLNELSSCFLSLPFSHVNLQPNYHCKMMQVSPRAHANIPSLSLSLCSPVAWARGRDNSLN